MINQIENFDILLLEYVQVNMRSELLDTIMTIFSQAGNFGLIWIITGLLLILSKKHRAAGYVLLLALIIGAILGDLMLKNLVARDRPFELHDDIVLLIQKPKDFSFPSGHTVSSFASAAVLFILNKYTGILGFILAMIISFSRLYLYVHYPSDIIGGIIVGTFAAFVSFQIIKRLRNQKE